MRKSLDQRINQISPMPRFQFHILKTLIGQSILFSLGKNLKIGKIAAPLQNLSERYRLPLNLLGVRGSKLSYCSEYFPAWV